MAHLKVMGQGYQVLSFGCFWQHIHSIDDVFTAFAAFIDNISTAYVALTDKILTAFVAVISTAKRCS